MVDDQLTGELNDAASNAASNAATLPELPATGDPAVDDAVGRLTELTAVPLDEHPAVYERVHRTLTDRLADVEG